MLSSVLWSLPYFPMSCMCKLGTSLKDIHLGLKIPHRIKDLRFCVLLKCHYILWLESASIVVAIYKCVCEFNVKDFDCCKHSLHVLRAERKPLVFFCSIMGEHRGIVLLILLPNILNILWTQLRCISVITISMFCFAFKQYWKVKYAGIYTKAVYKGSTYIYQITYSPYFSNIEDI